MSEASQKTPQDPLPAPSGKKRDEEKSETSIRETLESVIIAFVLAFVFRAFIVEAFVIPTGSMAPTLLGQHMQVACPQCGYRFTVGPRDYPHVSAGGLREPRSVQGIMGNGKRLNILCPMCEFPAEFSNLATASGDRILVLKYVYAFPGFHEPQRWDVVVFKNPEEPSINYIKRLVGLPGEQLWIVDGNIYTRSLDAAGQVDEQAAWQIQRKPDKAQRAVWQPIFHSDFFPLDGGQNLRRSRPWRSPWQAREAGEWSFDDRTRRWDHKSDAPGTLRFDFEAHAAYADHVYAYNQFSGGTMHHRDPVEDLRIAATVHPRAAGARVAMLLGSDGLMVRASIDASGKAMVETARRGDKGEVSGPWSPCITGQADPLEAGKPARIELWHVDQSVSLWINGRKVGRAWEYSLAEVGVDFLALTQGEQNRATPVAELSVTGPATVHDVDLDRDLYYTQTTSGNALATHDTPATITADRFFCCGDNSPESKDSRLWTDVDPWLKALTNVPNGFVPRKMMIGRAFFVYFPAPQPLKPLGMSFIPNFGKMRFIH